MIVNVKYTREDGNPFGRAYSYRTKLALGTGARVLKDPSVVFQANFPQGSSVATKYYDGLLGWTYFCRSARPELYE